MMLKAHQKFQLNHDQIYITVHRFLVKNDQSTDEVSILFFRSRINPTSIDSDSHSFMETPANPSSTTRSVDDCH